MFQDLIERIRRIDAFAVTLAKQVPSATIDATLAGIKKYGEALE